ncbi:hypothetical protein QTJ16_005595 [Diplocarpon rosae]|uniref:Uncharacterized protein n=1 Tax=Diplocarpon rosae TaxID=946125 RepID=A0AAD9SXA0_9HELO|nr:hypothetical protein QTJ16_005595 [Diplocarpon rosae]
MLQCCSYPQHIPHSKTTSIYPPPSFFSHPSEYLAPGPLSPFVPTPSNTPPSSLMIPPSTSLIPEIKYLLADQVEILLHQGSLDLAGQTAGVKSWTANISRGRDRRSSTR